MKNNYNVIETEDLVIGFVKDILKYLQTECNMDDLKVKQLYVDIKGNYYETDLIKVTMNLMNEFEIIGLEVE